MNKLLPCPFCGGEAEIVRNDVGVFIGCFHEKCPVAPSTGTFVYEYASEYEAIAAWNTRPQHTSVQSVITSRLKERKTTARHAGQRWWKNDARARAYIQARAGL